MVSLGQPRNHIFWTNMCAATAVRALIIAFVLTLVAIQPAQASNFNVIYNFTGASDGTSPYAGLTIDATGALYGTTLSGGAGYGTVFKLAKTGSSWVLTTLYTFTGGNDGASPRSRVIIGADGGLYGETFAGGGQGCGGRGCGTIFEVKRSCPLPTCHLTETVLYRFTGGQRRGPAHRRPYFRRIWQPVWNDRNRWQATRLWRSRLRHCFQADALRRKLDGNRALSVLGGQ